MTTGVPRSAKSTSTPANVADSSAWTRSQRSRDRDAAASVLRASANHRSSRAERSGAPSRPAPGGTAGRGSSTAQRYAVSDRELDPSEDQRARESPDDGSARPAR